MIRHADLLYAIRGGVNTPYELAGLLFPFLWGGPAEGGPSKSEARVCWELAKLRRKSLVMQVGDDSGTRAYHVITDKGRLALMARGLRYQRSRRRGAINPTGVVISRPNILGNPFRRRASSRVSVVTSRRNSIAAFKVMADAIVEGVSFSVVPDGEALRLSLGSSLNVPTLHGIETEGRDFILPDRRKWLRAALRAIDNPVLCWCGEDQWCHGDILKGLDRRRVASALRTLEAKVLR